ncbi:D-Ala-D-Ala carboxypeptidase family metallohydrolase [Phreatobacter sp.]|uniref:D-Ala-D-Ala carboxypeptidase family metallohydrolase n=1 Tax=Phreatobacter sp. TaxID=1966341 RepID=UPI0022BC0042|nr:D-Ala-D-Ala carboxypeptidase family metallohydrolase [Phreatobacter sp.]MCZ8314471.1 D-Ala-D-Ala carboxypeptidase family metallohydrolase [Phreatobacter sp.]
MTRAVRRLRAALVLASRQPLRAAAIGALVAASTPCLAQQSLGFQAGTAPAGSAIGGTGGQPLNLLSPSFIAPLPRQAIPPRGGAVPGAVAAPAVAAAPTMTAPMPLPRPEAAPRAVITQASAPAAVAAGMAPAMAATAQPPVAAAPAAVPPAAVAEAPPLLRPSMDEWPQDEDRSRIIIPGAYQRPQPQPQTGIEAIAAAAPQQARPNEPQLPARAVAFHAPVPIVRPGATTIVPVSTGPVTVAAPQLASAGSVPVSLTTQGSATTTVVPSAPAGSLPGAQQAIIQTRPTPATGPVLAALPPDGGARDWPRYVPGARGTDRNLGIAGERVMADPGVPLTCLPAPVRRALNDVALRFGPIIVRSTHRGNGTFVRTDAWRGSYHRDCRAADFRVSGDPSAIIAFLRTRPDLGGVKRYRNGLFHIDNGPRRSW